MTDMSLGKHAQRLCIYIGESDRWRGKPLYAALLETLRAHDLAGATVVRGVAGFGARSRVIHTATILRLSEDLPLRIEVVDAPDKIARALELIAPMVPEGLMTLEEVQVVRYTHRYLNPLPGDRLVSEVMTCDVVTLTPNMTVAQAWEQMLKYAVKTLPVVDEVEKVVGLLTDDDLLDRAGVRQRLSVARRLDAATLDEELEALRVSSLRVAKVMSRPVITARSDEPLGAAAARMTRRGVKRLPVVNAAGKLIGVLSRVDVLRQITDARPGERSPAIPSGAAQTLGDVMSPVVPTVRHDDDLAALVATFVETGSHRLIVVDDEGRAIGLVSDADVIGRVQPSQRRGLLAALRGGGSVPAAEVTARTVMSPGALTGSPDMLIVEAIRQMLPEGRKWLVVVDAANHPLGLVDRAILLASVAPRCAGWEETGSVE